MKILCIKDVFCKDSQTDISAIKKSFSEGKIYTTYPFKGQTMLYANDDTETMHCLGSLNENGTLNDEKGWFREHFRVIFK